MTETIYSNPNELYHYGVKGMKWGVRRYQNEDGTRTLRGKLHEKEFKKKATKVAAGAAIGFASVKGAKYLSTPAGKALAKKGAKAAANVLAKATKDAGTVIVTGGLIYAGEKAIDLAYGKEAANKVISYGRQPQKKK